VGEEREVEENGGEEREGKETDRCPLTISPYSHVCVGGLVLEFHRPFCVHYILLFFHLDTSLCNHFPFWGCPQSIHLR
jgi:hypothetical protein